MIKRDSDFFNNKMSQIQNQYVDLAKTHGEIKPRLESLKIIVVYLLVGGLWILLSGRALSFIVQDPEMLIKIEMYKGWFFVAITGVIFYYIILKKMMLFKEAIDQTFEEFEELSAAHQELMAMDEELTQQYNELEVSRNNLEISNQRYELVVEGANDGIWDWDLKTGEYFFSLKWKSTFGYGDKELPNTIETWKSLLHPEDKERSLEVLNRYLEEKTGIYQNIYRLRCKDGSYRWILSRGKGVWSKDGEPLRIAGSHTDITEQINLQEVLRQEKELSESIIYNAPVIIMILDTRGNIVKCNPFTTILTGFNEDELLGKKIADLFFTKLNREFLKDLFRRIKNAETISNQEISIQCKDGRLATILWNSNFLHDQQGDIKGIIIIGLDITDRRQMEEKLHYLAYYDHLTGLPNRTMLDDVGEKLINRARERQKKLAFIYLDIDNFKNINDTLGHGSGDKLLVYVARLLSRQIHPPNVIARLGGDEFAIILADIDNIDQVTAVINGILPSLRKPYNIHNREFYISVSIGVAIYPEHGKDLATLMQNADIAMFHIKNNSKDDFAIFSPHMQEAAWDYMEMSGHLKAAIQKERFFLHYQPQIDLKTGKIIGVEALIRWIHPEKGYIPPLKFITFAEETGDIRQIGNWVFKTVCRQKRSWEERGLSDIKVSINLSGKMLTQSDLVPSIQRMLEEHNMSCCDVVMEITETAVMADLKKSIEVLNELKELGVIIALDDFGTGYSSLTYLQKLPIDILKVDKEFIQNISKGGKELFIFKSIIHMAHNLGLKVVAEGVETEEQVKILQHTGCDMAQGFYFCKPLPPYELEYLFRKDRNLIRKLNN